MNIKRLHSSVLSYPPIIAGLLCLFNFHAVKADMPGDACALLTAPQISTALGASVGPGKPILPNHTTVCTWLERGVPEGTERNVSVSLMAPKSFEIGKTPMTGITKTPVSGLGDDAYFVEAHGMAAGLSVRKGDTCFQIRARSNPQWFKTGKTPESEAKDQAVDRALALEILKKL
jgi:hypothetical protein